MENSTRISRPARTFMSVEHLFPFEVSRTRSTETSQIVTVLNIYPRPVPHAILPLNPPPPPGEPCAPPQENSPSEFVRSKHPNNEGRSSVLPVSHNLSVIGVRIHKNRKVLTGLLWSVPLVSSTQFNLLIFGRHWLPIYRRQGMLQKPHYLLEMDWVTKYD